MDRAIRVCRSHGFVSTAKESIIFDMAKLCGVFFSINYSFTLRPLDDENDCKLNIVYTAALYWSSFSEYLFLIG